MELFLLRKIKTDKSTIGELSEKGDFLCYILEDKDRGIKQEMTLDEIAGFKLKSKTAIPTGRYEIAITFSNRFQKPLPLLLNVPGFEGIRIHPGNTDKDTEGCLLPGNSYSTDTVINSRNTFYDLFEKIEKALKAEKVFITIT